MGDRDHTGSAQDTLKRGSRPRVGRVADLVLRGGSGIVPVRVRWPAERAEDAPRPIIVLLPDLGAGCAVDSADDALAGELCSRVGSIVLCVPWAKQRDGAPASALERASAALEWAAEHGDELGADPRRLVIAGRGVGAAASTALAVRACDRRWPPIARQLLVLAGDASESALETRTVAALAPLERSLAGAAPATLVSAGPDGPGRCALRLREAGLEVEELARDGSSHVGADAPQCGLPEPLLAEVAGSLRRALSASTAITNNRRREATG